MSTFEWVDVQTIDEALGALRDDPRHVVAKAGGMDLLDLMKEGLVRPTRVVNLRTIREFSTIEFDPDGGLTLGAGATLASISSHAQIRRAYTALADAAAHAATPQVRNVATIAGNLLQRPRCWYFRNQHFDRASVNRAALVPEAENQYHAIFDNSQTGMMHASTPATALIALGASVHLTSSQGQRSVALEQFLRVPDAMRDVDADIHPGELITHVSAPPLAAGTRTAYHKQTERESYDWPVCDVAVVLSLQGKLVQSASIVMGWVAPTPKRASTAEAFLRGHVLDEGSAAEAARLAVAGATPLSKNGYRVPVLEAVVRRTLLQAVQ